MTDDRKSITGGCLCGTIRYEADHAPIDVGYCHCRMCQQSLGNLFGTWASFKRSGFRQTGIEPTWFASSDIANRAFCGRCGSPIAYLPNDSDVIYVWLGTLEDPVRFKPRVHYHVENRIPWANIQADLPARGAIRQIDA